MTLLTVVQDACHEIGFDAPATVASNPDLKARQALALANRAGKSLAQRHAWQSLTREWTHTTVAAEVQGLVEDIMPGFNWDIYETTWNRSNGGLRVGGPLYPQEWQAMKAAGVSGPYPDFRIQNKRLYLYPAPAAGETIAGEYVTRYWCEDTGQNGSEKYEADTDRARISEDLITADLKWRLLHAKGFDYAEAKIEAELLIANAMARDGSNKTLSLEGRPGGDGLLGGIVIPTGNWAL